MDSNKREFEWPAHATWWERNEKKVNIILWTTFIVLLIVARELFVRGIVTLKISIIWGALFILNLFLLSFVSDSVERARERMRGNRG